MRVVNIEARDVYVTLDLSAQELQLLDAALDHTTLEFDGEQEPQMKLANHFITETFAPAIKELLKEIS